MVPCKVVKHSPAALTLVHEVARGTGASEKPYQSSRQSSRDNRGRTRGCACWTSKLAGVFMPNVFSACQNHWHPLSARWSKEASTRWPHGRNGGAGMSRSAAGAAVRASVATGGRASRGWRACTVHRDARSRVGTPDRGARTSRSRSRVCQAQSESCRSKGYCYWRTYRGRVRRGCGESA